MAKIAVVLTEGFADWEYALIGGTGRPFYGFDVQYFAPEGGAVQSQGGLKAAVGQDMDDLATWQPDVVAVVGGMIWETAQAPDISDALIATRTRGATVAGICGGTLALARAGLLDDAAHTSNDADFLIQNATDYGGAANYMASASAVSSDGMITAAGTAPVSFAAAVFEAVGLPEETVAQFRQMMATEHA